MTPMLSVVEDGEITHQVETDLTETQIAVLNQFLYDSGFLGETQELHLTFNI